MGVDGEKERFSAEITRSDAISPNEPVLPLVNPAVVTEKKPEPIASSIHPAFYVSVWIALSSSIILFNKKILDDYGFRTGSSLHARRALLADCLLQIIRSPSPAGIFYLPQS